TYGESPFAVLKDRLDAFKPLDFSLVVIRLRMGIAQYEARKRFRLQLVRTQSYVAAHGHAAQHRAFNADFPEENKQILGKYVHTEKAVPCSTIAVSPHVNCDTRHIGRK